MSDDQATFACDCDCECGCRSRIGRLKLTPDRLCGFCRRGLHQEADDVD